MSEGSSSSVSCKTHHSHKRGNDRVGNVVFVDSVYGSSRGEVENQGKPFRTIREGIKAARGLSRKRGTVVEVKVRPGIYREGRILLYDKLSVIGSGRLSTIVIGFFETSPLRVNEEATVLELSVLSFEAAAVHADGKGKASFRRLSLESQYLNVGITKQTTVLQEAGEHIITDSDIILRSVGGMDLAVTLNLGTGQQVLERNNVSQQLVVVGKPVEGPVEKVAVFPSLGTEADELAFRPGNYVLDRNSRIPSGVGNLFLSTTKKTVLISLKIKGRRGDYEIKKYKTYALSWQGDGYFVRVVADPTNTSLSIPQAATIYDHDPDNGGRTFIRGNNSSAQLGLFPATVQSIRAGVQGIAQSGDPDLQQMGENTSLLVPRQMTVTDKNALIRGTGIISLILDGVETLKVEFDPTGADDFFLAVRFTISSFSPGQPLVVEGNLNLQPNDGSGSEMQLTIENSQQNLGQWSISNALDQSLFTVVKVPASAGPSYISLADSSQNKVDISQPVVNQAQQLTFMINTESNRGRVHIDSVTQHGRSVPALNNIPVGTKNQYTIQKIGTQGQHYIGGSEVSTTNPTPIVGDYQIVNTDSLLLFAGGNTVTLPLILEINSRLPRNEPTEVKGGTSFTIQVDPDATSNVTLVSQSGQRILKNRILNPGDTATATAYAVVNLPTNIEYWILS